MNAHNLWELLKTTFAEWNEDKAPRLAAALAYYTLFSIAPLIIIAVAVAGLVYGREAVQGQLFDELRTLVGDGGAEAIQQLVAGASKQSSGIIATLIGIVTLLLGAAGLFGELQGALNTIWEVEPKPDQGFWGVIRQRFFSFTMVLGTGFLLLVTLVISTILATVGAYFEGVLPLGELFWVVINNLISVAVTTGIFVLIFKYVPDVEINWGDVWIGALVTALLFSIGRFLLARYLGQGSFSSTYGAAGSFIVFLLWVNYSAQILFFGAEFTQVYARTYGSRIKPSSNAVALTEEARARQGIPHSETLERAVGGEPVGTPQQNEPAQAPRQGGFVGTVAGMIVGFMMGVRSRSRRR